MARKGKGNTPGFRDIGSLFQGQGQTLDPQQRELLNQQIDEGLAQLDRGEGIAGEAVFQALWEKSRKWRESCGDNGDDISGRPAGTLE